MRIGKRYNKGFSYVFMLLLISLLSIMQLKYLEVVSIAEKRERENNLIKIGNLYVKALKSYYDNSPGNEKSYPNNLGDLLYDSRFFTTHRYLRKIYPDPLKAGWGLVKNSKNQIIGVYSLSQEKPIRDFFQGQKKSSIVYSEWKFLAVNLEGDRFKSVP
jgi:hypothetical protein